jgi:hypothetical protein
MYISVVGLRLGKRIKEKFKQIDKKIEKDTVVKRLM